jgi:hypothetical protein
MLHVAQVACCTGCMLLVYYLLHVDVACCTVYVAGYNRISDPSVRRGKRVVRCCIHCCTAACDCLDDLYSLQRQDKARKQPAADDDDEDFRYPIVVTVGWIGRYVR